ncbi:MAG: divalent-cation tolerance protein CutA [Armatimonadetes bacterium]|nr:divalent-cation tolerance protein CutA [Armatimonadota bacterium]
MSEPLVVLVIASSRDEADRVASALVEEGLAACVNVVPGVRSVYRWQGRVERADELLLVVKTTHHHLADLVARVEGLHSYTVPEVLALPIMGGSAAYLDWLAGAVLPEAGSGEPQGE